MILSRIKVACASFLLVLAMAISALAASPVTMQSAASATVDGAPLNVAGYGSAGFVVSGTFSGTLTIEASTNGTTWAAWPCMVLDSTKVMTSTVSSTGQYVCQVAGLVSLRTRVSTYTSGTITVSGIASQASISGITGFKTDASGNVLFMLGNCIAGESFCIPDSPDSYLMTKGSSVVNRQIMTNVTTNTTSSTVLNVSGYKSIWATCVASSGVCAVTIVVYGDDDTTAGPNLMPLCTLTLSDSQTMTGGTGDIDWCAPFNATPKYLYAVTTGISGTAATVNVGTHH
jgi:hypothetical protein